MKGLDEKKVVKVVTALDDETIINLLSQKGGCGAGCPGKYDLPQANCDFISCKTCWKRALRVTAYKVGI